MNVVVIGGGTAGFLSGLLFKNKNPDFNVKIISSSTIGTLGPGEGLTPNIHRVLKDLDISLEKFLKETNGTIKNGVKFINWGTTNKEWFHSFYDLIQDNQEIFNDKSIFFNNYKTTIALNKSIDDINFGSQLSYENKISLLNTDDFSIHIDSKKMGDFLEKEALARGIEVIDTVVTNIIEDQNKNILGIITENNEKIYGDFFIDCTGFKRLIVGQHYKSEWTSVKQYLPANNAIACKLPLSDKLVPYTEARAMNAGWSWKIPLQNRYGCGYVYDKNYINKDEAEKELRDLLGDSLEVVGHFSFDPGFFNKIWINNCLAIGISASFFEPLEATTISMMIDMLYNFLDNCLDNYINDTKTKNGTDPHEFYNRVWVTGNESLTAFLYLHYITNKDNTLFWKNFKEEHPIPEFGSYNIKLFLKKMNEKLYHEDILTPLSWRLYSWLLVYAGNELHNSTVQVDNSDREEYNRVMSLAKEKTKDKDIYIEYIKKIQGENI